MMQATTKNSPELVLDKTMLFVHFCQQDVIATLHSKQKHMIPQYSKSK